MNINQSTIIFFKVPLGRKYDEPTSYTEPCEPHLKAQIKPK